MARHCPKHWDSCQGQGGGREPGTATSKGHDPQEVPAREERSVTRAGGGWAQTPREVVGRVAAPPEPRLGWGHPAKAPAEPPMVAERWDLPSITPPQEQPQQFRHLRPLQLPLLTGGLGDSWGARPCRAGGAQACGSVGGSSSSESNSAFSSFTHLPEWSWIQPALRTDRQTDRASQRQLVAGSRCGGGGEAGPDSPPQLQVPLQRLPPLRAEGFRPARRRRRGFSAAASLRPRRSRL